MLTLLGMLANIKEAIGAIRTDKAPRCEKRDPTPKGPPFPKAWVSSSEIYFLLGYETLLLVKILKSAILYKL